jgi:hypothetical protein
MPRMKVEWDAVQAESAVVNCPYDIVGVFTPAGQTLAGPYTVKVSHDKTEAPTAQTHNGAAIPDLTDGDTMPIGTYGFYSFVTLTATTPPADTTEYCYLIYRDFVR